MSDFLFNNNPIGIFDSGIGGINVLYRAKQFLPNENFVYLGDNSNTPYGNKSIEKLKELTYVNIHKLLTYNVKAICIACNTLSTSVYDYACEISKVPIIPTLPINVSKSGDNACLMATPNTINSNYVKTNFNGVSLLPLPFLAKEIEDNIFNLNKVNVRYDVRGVKNDCNLIILGCTHYSFVKKQVETLSGVKTVDTLDHTCNLLSKTVSKIGVNSKNAGKITFIGDFKQYNQKVYKFLNNTKMGI